MSDLPSLCLFLVRGDLHLVSVLHSECVNLTLQASV